MEIKIGMLIKVPDRGLYRVDRFYGGNPVLVSLNDGSILEENIHLANWNINNGVWTVQASYLLQME